MITIKSKGDFSKASAYLERLKEVFHRGTFDKYGQMGVEALEAATPVDSGLTAHSWSYEISYQDGGFKISWLNTNENKGVNIAIILQYGHGTGTGGWVEGRDYINPAIQPVFDEIANELWEEVTRL